MAKAEADEKYGIHKYLSDADFPKGDDFEEFYVYGEEIHMDLLGRKVAGSQNTIWGTGTHTSVPVPVPVIAWGPADVIAPHQDLMHHVNVGEVTINTLVGSTEK